jgi:hypothetical protein
MSSVEVVSLTAVPDEVATLGAPAGGGSKP